MKKVKKPAKGSRPPPARKRGTTKKAASAGSVDERDQMEAQAEELMAAQVELEDSRNRYAELFDHSPVGILTLDRKGEIFDVNIKAAELLGCPRDRVKGSVIGLFTASRSDLQRVLGHLRQCRKQVGEVRTALALRRGREGELLQVEMLSISAELGGNLFHTALVDLTERTLHEAALRVAKDTAERAAQAKDDFLAALSHELRTPLNPVLLIASQNAQNPELPDPARHDFETIAKNITLEARLIDDLLDLTQITQGKISLERRDVDIHAVLQDALTNVREDLDQKEITVTTDFAACEHAVVGDSTRLQQVFWNIIRNAAKFTARKGTLRIVSRCAEDGARIRFEFIDNGIGLRPAEIERIFDAFAQGEHAKMGPHRFGGLGLGLSISKRLVDLHGGTISASSGGPMAGSTFAVELPCSGSLLPVVAAPPAASAADASASVAGVVPKLLLVEDHGPTRAALTDLLGRRGYEVLTAGNVAEALAIAAAAQVDLVVSDIGLPDGDGYALMSELSTKYGLKGIALTGYGMEGDVALSRSAGFAAHLTKPIQINTLVAALKPLVG